MPDQIRSDKSLVVGEPNQLNALIKAIWTLKFEVPIENGGIYAGSPYIADLINRAYESLIGIYDDMGDSGSARALESWRKFTGKTVEPRVLAALVQRYKPKWDSWTEAQRYEYARTVLAPLLLTDAELASLVAELSAM